MSGQRETPGIGPADFRVLRSICRISARHALEAVSTLSGLAFDLERVGAELVPVGSVASRLGSEEQRVAVVSMKLRGALDGVILVAIEPSPAVSLLSRLSSGQEVDFERLTELQASALRETGNIVAGAFCKGMSGTSGRPLLASTPDMAIDMAASIIEAPVVEATEAGDEALVLESLLTAKETEEPLGVHILLIPSPGAIPLLLDAGRNKRVDRATGGSGF